MMKSYANSDILADWAQFFLKFHLIYKVGYGFPSESENDTNPGKGNIALLHILNLDKKFNPCCQTML